MPEKMTGGFRPASDFNDGYYSGPLRPNDSLNMPDYGGRPKMPEDHAVVGETIHRLGHDGNGFIETSALLPTGGETTYVIQEEESAGDAEDAEDARNAIKYLQSNTPQQEKEQGAYESRFELPPPDGYSPYQHVNTPDHTDPHTEPSPTYEATQRSDDGSPPPPFIIPPSPLSAEALTVRFYCQTANVDTYHRHRRKTTGHLWVFELA